MATTHPTVQSQHSSGKGSTPREGRPEERPAAPQGAGLRFERYYTAPGVDPYDTVEWETRDAVITNERGEVIFEQLGVEVPKTWSQTATNVVVSKYFRGHLGAPQREHSVRQLIGRVADTIAYWGRENGYFATADDADAFHAELTHVLLYQMACFNSPVWFNVGIEPKPQCSACFINSVEDTMDSILRLARTEGMLFKFGSGTGSNLSTLRSSREPLAGGGTASGPVSFMRGFDAFAGVIKSGGKTRRAAKMVILNANHPDIEDFIKCKEVEEKKAWALIDAGFEGGFNVPGGAYDSIAYQNANHSVRVTDEFMQAVLDDGTWTTHAVRGAQVMGTYRARELMKMIADSTWVCGDPGMQYDTTINDWHTCSGTARINSSNPCVTGDTLVATADGWQRIDALVGKTARVIGADGAPHLVTRIFPTGRKPVFRLRTRAGYEVRITGDHRVLTCDRGDQPASELRVGEKVLLQGPGFGRRALGERLASAIGIAAGDGCLTRSYASGRLQEIVILTMAAGEADVLARVAGAVNEAKALARAVGSVGNAAPVRVTAKGTGSRLSFSSRAVVELFKEFAVLDEGSHRKLFTQAIFELDRPSLAAVLRGLFTADGSVANYGVKSQYVALDSTSLELLQQVQLLLLGFGIKSKLYRERRGGASVAELPDGRGGSRPYPVQEMHALRISRSSRILFEREIGFDPASPKAAALRELNDQIAAYRDELTDRVAAIEPLGEEEVFDLTEEATHHFVANGLVVHNCSEYMFLDDTACNLASLNLMRFFDEEDQGFDAESFRHACEVVVSAMEIIVDNASYPTERIDENSRDYRPLGLGYANLGALLMARGIPYDSDAGRDYAAAITALMSGAAYAQSARLAEAVGPFAGFEANRGPMLRVMRKHRDAVKRIDAAHVPLDLLQAAKRSWEEVLELGEEHGLRNSQISVLAPTGTIAFMMDCDTTGVEPDIALVKYKKLVGGGMIKIVNNTVPLALKRLGYDREEVRAVVEYIDEHDTIEGAPQLKEEHLPVFDCAFKPAKGSRSIAYRGHLKMLAAVQPFVSGAISKTINMPEESTPEEILNAYVEGWQLGLKAVAIYRDGCKRSQPLSTKRETAAAVPAAPAPGEWRAVRRKLPDERRAITHKFSINEHEGYITVGLYDDGLPGEIFLVMAKEGSTISGLMDAFATSISIALQYGVPLQTLIDKFSHTRFEPSGFTKHPEIPIAKSITDYLFRWLASKFLSRAEKEAAGVILRDEVAEGQALFGSRTETLSLPAAGAVKVDPIRVPSTFLYQQDAPSCHECGAIMVRNGSCYKCLNCGSTSGCS
ncbi:MAG TPA: LAGLIDADG family homing endonuclease [Thermoanaerobaculia bacterium]